MNLNSKDWHGPANRLTRPILPPIEWLKRSEAMRLVGLAKSAFYAHKRTWINGVQYQQLSARTIRYNKFALEHWMASRHTPLLHQQWCRDYLDRINRTGGAA